MRIFILSCAFGTLCLTSVVAAQGNGGVNVRRSLAVTDLSVLNTNNAFSLQRVMAQLASGTAGSPAQMYSQWWDTQNDLANAQGAGAHCDDEVGIRGPEINGFPIQCPRQEGVLATTDPFMEGLDCYVPVGLFNRFDLAPSNGAHCGEYRIIYGKTPALRGPSGAARDRNLIIFEARLPNPDATAGLEGCRPVAEFWASLSSVASASQRGKMLEGFYFDGLSGFAPVIKAEHFAAEAGQIRTNQFMTGREYLDGEDKGQPWQLREFKLERMCSDEGCVQTFVQVSDKGNPFAELMDDRSDLPLAGAFRRHFLSQVEALSATTVTGISMAVPERFNAAESTSQGAESDLVFHLDNGSGAFSAAVEAAVPAGRRLSARHIARRAMATTCAGCHQLNNSAPANNLGGGLVWPSSLGFVHVSELQRDIEPCGRRPRDGRCWGISPALKHTFLPARKAHLDAFLGGVAGEARRALRVH